ncbi:hypothetical protein ACOMHN_056352 [Nucella lapillus]
MSVGQCAAVRVGLVGLWVIYLATLTAAQPQNTYALDRQSTCGQTLTVYDKDLILEARSNVAPANPPLDCKVFLQSAYGAADGRSRLQIIVQQLQIEDCKVKLHLFNGIGATGNSLRALGCGSSSTDIIYSKDRQVTVHFIRPRDLYQTNYMITLAVRAYEDGDAIGTAVGVARLSVGAIVGIVVGVLVVIALAILLGWCCCTGYIHNFLPRGGRGKGKGPGLVPSPPSRRPTGANVEGSIDSNLEKLSDFSFKPSGKNGIPWEDSSVWASGTGNGQQGNFRQGVPRRVPGPSRGYTNPQADHAHYTRSGREGVALEGRAQGPDDYRYGNQPARDLHVYEPYDNDNQKPLGSSPPRFRKRGEGDPRASARSRGSRRSRNSATGEVEGGGGGRETGIDDPGSQSESSEEEMKKAKLEDSDTDDTSIHKEGSQVDVDTIASPMHVNGAVRASVPDLTDQPSSHEGSAPKGGSPRSRKRPRGGHGDPDPMGLPPEAFDPVFTTPTSEEQYPGEWRPLQQPPPLSMPPFMPYGFVPLVPGQQTYAYAYQTAPQVGSYPGQQGAYFVQSVPTAEGDVQKTAFAVHSERTPKGQAGTGRPGRKQGQQHPGSPDFSSTPVSGAGPLSVPPQAPGRSVAMKSSADPDTGIQATQVTWTDNVPDPTDPKPGESSQVTRKTTTRVTTRGGYGDLPQQTATLLDEPDPSPAFLSPSANRQAALPPAAITPSDTNVHYYTGQRSVAPPRPDVVHEGPGRNRAIKDTVTLSESSEV